MKKKIIVSILAATMVLGSLTGCGDKKEAPTATTESTESTETEALTETEETTETEVSTEEVASTEVAEDPETTEETAAIPEEPVETIHFTNPLTAGADFDIPAKDPENEYVKKLHDAGIGVGRYEGAVIKKLDTGEWVFYYEGDDTAASTYEFIKKDGSDGNAKELYSEYEAKFLNDADKYVADYKNGSYPIAVDLDGDGILSQSESSIAVLFYASEKGDFVVKGMNMWNFTDPETGFDE